MWFKLANADFSNNNLGKMSTLSNSISITYNSNNGFSAAAGSSAVLKTDSSKKLTLNLLSGWTCEAENLTIEVSNVERGTIDYNSGKLEFTITPSGGSTFGETDAVSNGISIKIDGAVNNGGSGGEGNIAHYLLNKNIFSDGLITNQSGPGRLAIVEFFPTNGSELTVSSSIATNTIAKRYYKADKSTMASSASDSAYGRVVLVVGSTPLSDVYEGQTLTVNGTTYTLQNGAVSDVVVKYELGANIGSDGEVQSNYADAGRIAILHYFETNGKELTAAYSNAAYAESTGIAKRYYDGDKNGGATAATSTYGRLVLYNGTAESAIAENIEGTKITVNGVSYTLSNA